MENLEKSMEKVMESQMVKIKGTNAGVAMSKIVHSIVAS